jgi:hypothetical protein
VAAHNTFWVIVPGFGPPRIDDKLTWLRANLERFAESRGPWTVRVSIFCYAHEPLSATALPAITDVSVEITHEPGIVFQYLRKHITPETVDANAAFVFFLLDDIRLPGNFSLQKAIDIYARVNCDLLEAALTPESPTPWDIMRQDPEVLRRGLEGRRTNFAEFFATLMSAAAYRRYYSTCLTDDTAWGWGIDQMLDSLGFRLFLWDACPVAHQIKGGSYGGRPDKEPHAELTATKARLRAKGGKPISCWTVYEYL